MTNRAIARSTRTAEHGAGPTRYRDIYAVVGRIPRGRVATYGQVARLVGRCTARMVGYAMAALPSETSVPWQRVVNHRGEVSPRRTGTGAQRQRRLLEGEGVTFDVRGRIDLSAAGWTPRHR